MKKQNRQFVIGFLIFEKKVLVQKTHQAVGPKHSFQIPKPLKKIGDFSLVEIILVRF